MVFLSLLSMVQASVVWVGMAAGGRQGGVAGLSLVSARERGRRHSARLPTPMPAPACLPARPRPGLAVCVRGVARGTLTVGDTVLFVTMMQQLYVPLTYFGSYYRQASGAPLLPWGGQGAPWGAREPELRAPRVPQRCPFLCACRQAASMSGVDRSLPPPPPSTPPLTPQVQKALIDMENMFELLATEPSTKDDPGARPLAVTRGRVDFRDVVFGYNAAAPVLKVRPAGCCWGPPWPLAHCLPRGGR
jgi:ABC-type multidrug transport system fused ATPase/permease subunit